VCVCQVAVSFHAELKQPSSCSIEAAEDEIVSEYKIRLTAGDPRNEAVKKFLADLNLTPHDVLFVHSESIECCFICSSTEQLMQLRRHFESGVMKNVLQSIFSLLMNGDELIVINQLKWDSKNYWEGVQQLNKLKPLG
jgi:hypothetical protein